MNRGLLTYLFLALLALMLAKEVLAGVTDPVVNALDAAQHYIEQAATIQEEYTSTAQGYITGKVGEIGDTEALQKKARKAEKAKQRLERLQAQAAHAKEKMAKLKERAETLQKQYQDAKQKAAQIMSDAQALRDDIQRQAAEARKTIDDAKEEVNKVQEQAKEIKDQAAQAGEMASALKETASSAVSAAKDKYGMLPEKQQTPIPTPAITAIPVADTLSAISAHSTRVSSAVEFPAGADMSTLMSDISAAEVIENSEGITLPETETAITERSIEEQLTGEPSGTRRLGEDLTELLRQQDEAKKASLTNDNFYSNEELEADLRAQDEAKKATLTNDNLYSREELEADLQAQDKAKRQSLRQSSRRSFGQSLPAGEKK